MFMRNYRGERRCGRTARDAQTYAFFVLLGKFPQASGQLKYVSGRLRGKRSRLIEYKRNAGPAMPGAR